VGIAMDSRQGATVSEGESLGQKFNDLGIKPMADWVRTFQGAVLAAEYDGVSYMNSRMYGARFDQATWFLLHAVGITPARMRQEKLRIAIVRENYQFLQELRGGELVEVRSGFSVVGEKYFRFLHQMYNCETRQMIATCDCVAVEASLETGRSVALPAETIARAKQFRVSTEVAGDSQPPGV
jgi:acyl-CoA thioester hydrolase